MRDAQVTTIWLKEKCVRCNGNLYVERCEYGVPLAKCLLCSRTFKLRDVASPEYKKTPEAETC